MAERPKKKFRTDRTTTTRRRPPEVYRGEIPWTMSIVTLVLCCQPLGIVAVVFCAMATSARDAGNDAALISHRRYAKMAANWGFWLGAGMYILTFGIAIIGSLLGNR